MAEFEKVLFYMEEAYSDCRNLEVFELSREVLRNLIMGQIDWTSTPGYPYNKYGTTNRELFKFDGLNIDETRFEMIYGAVELRWRQLLIEPEADPINLFIKREPHKIKKLTDQAYRIIHGVSIIDNLIARLLYGKLFDNMIANWMTLPSKIGWTPGQGGYKLLAAKYKRTMYADKSAWDWTMQPWCVNLLIDLMTNLGPDDSLFRIRSRNHLIAIFGIGAKFTADGVVFSQTVQGIMKSGYLGTIGFNSMLQTALHVLAKIRLGQEPAPYPDSVGDDTIQHPEMEPETYVRTLEKGGCVVKEYGFSEGVDFVGHTFNEQKCIPNYRLKHCFKLFHVEEGLVGETLEAFQYLYPHDLKFLEFIQKVMINEGFNSLVRSPSYLRYWYDHAC